jgi:hypothetical protein
MISEFQELSDKIDQLAEMTVALRRENAQLRQGNAELVAQTIEYHRKMREATARLEALLQKIPPLEGADAEELPDNEDAR